MRDSIEIKTITPKDAIALLEDRFEGQRKVRKTHVQRLAEDMRLGRFKLSPDAIVLCMGKLANGQHRLEALIEAGLAQRFLVMTTNDAELYKVLDSGIGRTVGDVITTEHANDVAAVSRLICLYDKKVLTALGGSVGKMGRLDVINYAEAHGPEIVDAIQFIRPLQRQTPIVATSVMAATALLGERSNNERSRQFVQSVFTGSEPNTAAWLFRERMIANSSSKTSRLPRHYIFALALKSLKSYCNGNKLGVLKMAKGEMFPEL